MGISAKKTKTTQNQSFNQNQNTDLSMTPLNPSWVEGDISGLADKIRGTFNGLDPSSLVAPANPLQTQAAQTAAGLTGGGRGFGQAQATYGGIANGTNKITAASLLDNLQSYMSPYLKDVVDASANDFDVGAGYTRAQNKLDLANDATFGGSGGAIQTSLSEDALNRARASLLSGLRDQGFQVGANLSNLDAQRRQDAAAANLSAQLAAAGGLTSNAVARGAEDRANLGTQMSAGDLLRQIDAAKRLAPISALGMQSAALSGLPLDLLHGQRTQGTINTQGTSQGASTTKEGAGLLDFIKLATAAMAAGG